MKTIRAARVGATTTDTYTPAAPDWTGAACHDHDPEKWYPDPTDTITTLEAVTICHGCPVRQACLEQAMREEPAGGRYGIRGGLTPEERRKIGDGTDTCPECGRIVTPAGMNRHNQLCASTRETIRLHQQGTPWAEIARIQDIHGTTVSARIAHWKAEQ